VLGLLLQLEGDLALGLTVSLGELDSFGRTNGTGDSTFLTNDLTTLISQNVMAMLPKS
jgi:hypothetical protein